MTKNKSGFTLVEMVVLSCIFMILMTVVYSVYIFQQKAYRTGESSAEIIQNGRVVLERMTRELRQAKKIVTVLPASEIKIQDGHLAILKESGNSQGGTENSINLALSSSLTNDYYKDLYIKIVSGTGAGQVKKIYSYDGILKKVEIEGQWQTIPDVSSVYVIDSSFYYIHYYKDADSRILRKVYTCCFSFNGLTCDQPETYVDCSSTPLPGYQILEAALEDARVVGEYVSSLSFSGSQTISISIELQKDSRTFNLRNQIYGRNL